MTAVRKVAISVPAKTLEALEKHGQKIGATRSRMVTVAIEHWLRAQEVREDDRRYVEGYLRRPEELGAATLIARETITAWEPWDEEG